MNKIKINFEYLSDILNNQITDNQKKVIFSDLHIRGNKKIYIRKSGSLEEFDNNLMLSNEEVLSIIKEIIEYKYNAYDEEIKDNILNDLKNKGQELDLSIELPIKGGGKPIFRARLNIFKTNGTYGLVLRVIPTNHITLEELNLFQEHTDIIKRLLKRKEGLILITGQTGSGKSTTMAAMLDNINSSVKKHIITIEDPVEFYHEDKQCLVTHREVGKYSDTQTFESGIRAALREDPDVIQIGEMRDAETALSALQAAQTGHIVLATLHTNNCAETILRLIDMFPSDKTKGVKNSLSNSLLMILSQRLVKNAKGKYILVYEMLTKNTAISTLLLQDNFKKAGILDTMTQKMEEGMIPLNYCLKRRIEETGNEDLKISIEAAKEITYDETELTSLLKKSKFISNTISKPSEIKIQRDNDFKDKWE